MADHKDNKVDEQGTHYDPRLHFRKLETPNMEKNFGCWDRYPCPFCGLTALIHEIDRKDRAHMLLRAQPVSTITPLKIAGTA